ncbi:MAG: hypothetical protein ACI8RZ_008115, partial [Myxococcota bacterium]
SRLASLAQLESRTHLERRRLESERTLEENRQALAMEKSRREAALKMAQMALAQAQDEATFTRNQQRAEQAAALAEQEASAQQDRQRQAAQVALELAKLQAETAALLSDQKSSALRARLAAEDSAGRASLERLFLTESLPALAATVGKSLEHSKMVVYQGEGGGPVPMALSAVLDVMRERLAGVE